MLLLGLLLLATSGSKAEERVNVYGVHLLNPDKTDDSTREGLLLIETADHELSTICLENLNSSTYVSEIYTKVCGEGRHDVDVAEDRVNRTRLEQFSKLRIDETGQYFNKYNGTCKYGTVYLECNTDDNSTDPEWEFEGAALLYMDQASGEIVIGENEGLLGVHFIDRQSGEKLGGTVCDDNFNDHAANLSCQYLGYDYAASWGSHDNNQYVPESFINEHNIPILVNDITCERNDSHILECDAKFMDHNCSHYEDIWLKCAPEGDDNSTDPDWELEVAALYHMDQDGNIVVGNEGLLAVYFIDKQSGEEIGGTVCDDNFNDHAANLSCKYLGYDYAASWGNHDNSQYVPESFINEYNISIVVDEITCERNDSHILECDAKIMDHDCSHYEDIWLKCAQEGDDNSTDSDWEFEGAALLYMDQDGEIVVGGNEGLLGVHFIDRQSGEKLGGTVCDDNFNDHAANLSCQYLGYDYAASWGSHDNNQYVPMSFINEHNIPILVDEITCERNDSHILLCDATFMDHDCSHYEDIWLKCAKEGDDNSTDPDWELGVAKLYHMDQDGNIVSGNEGLLAVYFMDKQSGEEIGGTVCDDNFNNHAANLSCQYLGYDYAASWGSHDNNQYVPESVINEYNIPIVVDDVTCERNDSHILECDAKIMEHNCKHSDDIWLQCAKDEGPTIEPTIEPTVEPTNSEIDLEFDGLKLALKLGKHRYRARW